MALNPTPISVFMITLNEAQYIQEALNSVQSFAEIIVVDSGSTDGTQQIAKSMGARVIHQDWLGFAKQKEFAMSKCKHDWVLNLDADEVLSEQLTFSIQEAVDNRQADAFRLSFDDLFWGTPMSSLSRNRSIVRVFRKDAVCYPTTRKVHENVQLMTGMKETYLPSLVKHYGYDSVHVLMEKQNKYSLLKAQEKMENGKKPSLFKLLTIFPFTFIKSWIFRGMIFSGKRGFVQAHIEAMYAFLKEAKLYELYKRR
jgi:glycosyltransferase involved in cell wall biosynthesis